MRNKRLFIFVVMIFSVLVFSGVVSADWDVKVNWNGNAFDWASAGCFANDGNSEKGCISYSGDPNLYLKYCGNGNAPSGYTDVGTDHMGTYYVSLNPAYDYNYWRFGECNNRHQVGKHFENRAHENRNRPGSTSGSIYAYVTCSDTDGDSYASSVSSWASSINVCGNTESVACDKDSSTYGIYSVGTEICDGKDNNCDGNTDEGNVCIAPCTDDDGDDYGAQGTDIRACTGSTTEEDCDDNDINNFPGNPEICDGFDNDCDDVADEGVQISCYLDSDLDGYGSGNPIIGCSSCASGYVNIGGDCDDDNDEIYIGATEICDGVDNQCLGAEPGFGEIDENNGDCDFPALCISGDCATPIVYWAEQSDGEDKITPLPAIRDGNVGDDFYLVLENPPSITNVWKFEIYEDDLIGEDNIRTTADGNALTGTLNTNGKIIAKWTITQADIDNAGGGRDKFYFIATKTDIPIFQLPDINLITGKITGAVVCDRSSKLCPDGSVVGKDPDNNCEFYACPQTDTFTSDPFLELEWIGGPQPASCSDNIQNQGESGIDCGGPCPACPEDGIDFCVDTPITICSDYTEESKCINDFNECGVAGDSVPDNVDCVNPNIACGCSWDESTGCDSYSEISTTDSEGDQIKIGTCNYESITTGSCPEDGSITISLTGTWEWDPLNIGQDDPDGKAVECLTPETTLIVCPAQVQLPLTNWFSIIAIVVIIALGYVLFSRDNKIKK